MAGNNRPARTAIVVGGGIGGLAAGMALLERGWRVQVLERAAMFSEVGAGLSLWPNGVRALSALGLGDQVRDQALVETVGGARAPRRSLSGPPGSAPSRNGPLRPPSSFATS